jgi:hypothetical protein
MRRHGSTSELRAAVFARERHLMRNSLAGAILLLLIGVTFAEANELKQRTLQSWESYVQSVRSTLEDRSAGRKTFLWVDETPDLIRRVKGGEVVVTSLGPRKAPQGLIHHWIGAMFLQGVTIEDVQRVLNHYDRYQDYYRPMVVKSELIELTDDHAKAKLMMMTKALGVTAAVETDDDIQITKLDANRMYWLSDSEHVQEIGDYGQPGEHRYPEDKGPGYVWRSLGVTRVEQRDGGVYVETETIALSRGIPWEFRWLIKPLTENLPRKIMVETLNDTRSAVSEQLKAASNAGQKTIQGSVHK